MFSTAVQYCLIRNDSRVRRPKWHVFWHEYVSCSCEELFFLSFCLCLHLMWVYLHFVWELKKKLLFWLDCCSARSQRKCRWSASGLPLHGCCSQPIWWRPLFRGQPEVVQPNAVIESVEVAGIQTVYLLTASPQALSHLPQHLMQTGRLCYPRRSSRSRPLRQLSVCFWQFLCLLPPSVLVWEVLMHYVPLERSNNRTERAWGSWSSF